MKKNILAVIILALSLVNIVLSAVIIFTVIPTMKKTSNLIDRVVSIIDLELETPSESVDELTVADIETMDFEDKFTCTLKKSNEDNTIHYAVFYLSLYINKKNADTETLKPYIENNKSKIQEIVTEEFSKYTRDEISENKDVIKNNILKSIQNIFHSEFIIDISFGNIITN